MHILELQIVTCQVGSVMQHCYQLAALLPTGTGEHVLSKQALTQFTCPAGMEG